jgi:hypothetical protein
MGDRLIALQRRRRFEVPAGGVGQEQVREVRANSPLRWSATSRERVLPPPAGSRRRSSGCGAIGVADLVQTRQRAPQLPATAHLRFFLSPSAELRQASSSPTTTGGCLARATLRVTSVKNTPTAVFARHDTYAPDYGGSSPSGSDRHRATTSGHDRGGRAQPYRRAWLVIRDEPAISPNAVRALNEANGGSPRHPRGRRPSPRARRDLV